MSEEQTTPPATIACATVNEDDDIKINDNPEKEEAPDVLTSIWDCPMVKNIINGKGKKVWICAWCPGQV